MISDRLFHISEEPGIKIFKPRLSPSAFDSINADVVFAISDRLLHNYLLPRDCPRVTFYAKPESSSADKEKFMGQTTADFVIVVETEWFERIKQTTLYRYEFPAHNFILLDEGAGYYISYDPVTPVSVSPIVDVLAELSLRNVELRFMSSLLDLADEVSKSSLQFSIIRMRNASVKQSKN